MRTKDWPRSEGTDCRDPLQCCVPIFSDYSINEKFPWVELLVNSDLNLVVCLSVMAALREMGYLFLPTADKEGKHWQRGKSHEPIFMTTEALSDHASFVAGSSLGNISS